MKQLLHNFIYGLGIQPTLGFILITVKQIIEIVEIIK